MRIKTPEARRVLPALTAAAMLLLLASCEMPPVGEPLPKLSDLRSTWTPPGPDGEATPTDARPPVIALIHRIDLPLDVSTDPMWASVDEQSLPARTVGMWRANGLRIGVLLAERAPEFSQQVPRILGESRAKLIGSAYPSTVRTTPRLRSGVVVDLTDPPMSPLWVEARGGHLQLLAKVGRDEAGNPYMELTPHHYKPKTTLPLLPRNPLEKNLDGQVYGALTARLALPPDRAVVVGLYRPWPKPTAVPDQTNIPQDPPETEQAQPSSKESNADDDVDESKPDESGEPGEPGEPGESGEPTAPPIPNHLGKALMTGERAGREIQILLIISAYDLSTNDHDADSDAAG